jgi:hypothetical protein
MAIAAKDSANADTSKHKKNTMADIVHHSVVQDGLLVISGSKETSENYFKSEKRNTDFISDSLRQSPGFVLIDLHAIIDYISKATADQPNQEKTRAIMEKLGVLDKLTLSGTSAQNGEIRTSFELTTTRTDENILKTIINMAH